MKTYNNYKGMKSIARLITLVLLLCMAIGNAWGEETTAFSETFAKCTGTFGWSGSASNGEFTADNSGWTTEYAYGAGGSAKFGTGSKKGTAQTPNISCGAATTATLTFKAGAWNASSEKTTLVLTYINCSGANSSVTMEKGKFNTYTVTLSNISGSIKIKFAGQNTSDSRFLLDDVVVKYNAAACTAAPTVTAGSNSAVTSTTATISCAGGLSSLGTGGCSVTGYGFVIGPNANPELSGEGTTTHQVGTSYSTTGTPFQKNLTELSPNTTFYVRPYATNGSGTGYGAQTSFTTLQRYTITYNNNGGSNSIASAYKDHGVAFILPNNAGNMTKTGYHIADWKLNSATGTSYALGGSYTGNEAAEFYAGWVANSYTVQFNKNNNSAFGSMSNQAFTYDEAQNLTECGFTIAASTHKYFAGWATTTQKANAGTVDYADGASVSNITGTNNGTVTLYAVWKDHTYTNYRTTCCTKYAITKAAVAGGTLVIEEDKTEACADELITLTATPDGDHVGGTIKVIKTGANPVEDVTETYYNAGTGKLTMPAFGVTISATFAEPSSPLLVVSGEDLEENTLAFGDQGKDQESTERSFTVTGSNLTAGVTWELSGTDASMFAVTPASPLSQSAVSAGQEITVTFTPTSIGEKSATLTFSSTGAPDKAIALTGTGKWVVAWVANDGEPAFATTLCADGETPTLPDGTPTSCDGTSTAFAGWTQTKWIGKLSQTEVDAKAGAEKVYTSAAGMPAVTDNVTYHAVFAARTQTGVEAVKAQTLQYDTWTYSGSTTDKSDYRMFHTGSYIESAAFDLSTLNKVKIYGGYFGNSNCLTMTIDDGTNTWKNVTLESSNNQSNENEFTEGAALSGTGKLYIRSTCGSTDGNGSGIRLTKVEFFVNSPIYSYSDYMTTCRDDVHSITIADGISGGSVNTDKWGIENESVTLTATPNDGYNFGSWNVTKTGDAGTVVPVENNAFTMPAYDVTVSATFAPKPMTALTLSESALLGEVGNGATLTVSSYEPADLLESQKTVNWTSDNASVASVENGVVSYNAPGTATITAAWTQDADVKATCAVTVYQWNLAGTDTYEVTDAPETSYTDIAHFDKSAVTIKANYVRSDDPALTKQEQVASENWTAKLNGTEIADNYPFLIEDNGKTLALYVGETLVWSEAITVVEETKDRFVDNLWGNATIFRTGTDYTLPVLENQTAGDAATCNDHNIFMGWVLAANADDPQEQDLATGAQTASERTFYAVWKKSWNEVKEFQVSKVGFTNSETSSGIINSDVSYETKKNGGSTDPGLTGTSLRLYQIKSGNNDGNSITISGTGVTLTKVELITAGQEYGYVTNSYTTGNISALTQGTVTDGKITLNELSTDKLTIVNLATSNSNRLDISKIDVTYEKEVTINDYLTDCTPRYDVEFEAGTGAVGSYDKATKKAGVVITLPDGSALTKEHYTFAGWYSAHYDQTFAGNASYTVPTDGETLVAQWNENHHAFVHFKDGENEVAGSPIKVYDAEVFNLFDAPVAQAGKQFVSWTWNGTSYNAGQTNQHMSAPAEERTYTAVWIAKQTEPEASVDFSGGKWILVTDARQLKAGDMIVIAAANANMALSNNQKPSNRGEAAVTKTNDTLSFTTNVAPLFLQQDAETGFFAIYDRAYDSNQDDVADASGYLYASGGSSNNLLTQSSITMQGLWSITIADKKASIIAQGNNGNRTMRYNSGSNLFTCYSGENQQPISIYKWHKTITGSVDVSDIEWTDAVIVKNGATLTVDAASTLDNLTIEAGGKVETTNELTVNNLLIKTSLGTISRDETNTNGKSGEITNGNNIVANGDVFIEIELTQEDKASTGWYAFSVPFPVDAINGVYYNDTKLTNEVGYAIMSYHGDVRAQGQYAWKKYRGIMQPGTLYIITVGKTYYKTLRFKKVAGADLIASNEIAVKEYPLNGGTTGDNGWNGIGNPNLQVSRYTGSYLIQFLDHQANSFKVRNASAVNLMVGSAFMMQSTATENITITAGNGGSIALAPAREMNAEENTLYEVKLRNNTTNIVEDNLFFMAREDATNSYETGYDLVKLSMGEAKCAQMYVPAYGTKLCAADFRLVNDKAEYPLTITAPADGTYRIETPTESEDATLYLTKDGRAIWNLSISACEVELTKGTTENYGLLLVRKAPGVATGMENVQSDNVQCTKVIIDNQVFILRGGQMYDVTGKAVK